MDIDLMNTEAVAIHSQREADRAAGRAEMAALILDMVAGSRIPTAAPTNLPTAAELNTIWLDYDDPVDFAGAVLERWGGWLPGILGYGGALAARLQPQPRIRRVPGVRRRQAGGCDPRPGCR